VSRKSGPVNRPGTGGLCGRNRGYRHRTQCALSRACRSCSPACMDGHGSQGYVSRLARCGLLRIYQTPVAHPMRN